jgi:hypothetical protein
MSASLTAGMNESDREQLQECLQRLLASGAILREDHRDLYDWARLHREAVDELCWLAGLKLVWEHDNRLLLGIPQHPRLLRRLRQDETLIVLALWYDFDRQVKDEGRTPEDVGFRVREFSEQFEAKFRHLQLPATTRLLEILHLLEKKSVVRLSETAGPFTDILIRVLPTIRYLVPFSALDEWTRTRDRHLAAGAAGDDVGAEQQG